MVFGWQNTNRTFDLTCKMPRKGPSPALFELAIRAKAIVACHGVTLRTVRQWCERGDIAEYRLLPSGSIEVPVRAYVDFLESRHVSIPLPPRY